MNADLKWQPIILGVCLGMLFAVAGCSKTPTSTTTTGIQSPQPVEAVSVTGPLQPINPGGPIVEVTLKNRDTEPIVALTADLKLSRTFTFNFDVTSSNPLLADKTVSAKLTLIGIGFSDSLLYPLTITGMEQNGVTFTYTEQVQIVAPTQ